VSSERAKDSQALETRAVHAGEPDPRIEGAITTPIFQAATFETRELAAYDDIRYARLSNTPTHEALHQKLASIEGGEAALSTSSGMAAISTTLLTFLAAGDHLLAQNVLYGGTWHLMRNDLPALGIEIDYVDGNRPEQWKEKLKPNTRAVYVESIANPLMIVADHQSVVAFAREHGLTTIIDNTFASPVNFRPLELGYDIVLHSATKYLNGHSDLIAGAVVSSGETIERIRHKLNHLGGSLDPHACFLLSRGLKTLVLRVRQQNANALTLARALDANERVRRVFYPGLDCHAAHARARRLFEGFGGMLAFDLAGNAEASEKLLSKLRLAIPAPSLGGAETLVSRPAVTSHAGIAPEELHSAGITESLLRVSVGIEAAEDLVEDFLQALE
jgi:cystathionine beta-lyase/cystathionine gamma-synthase